MPVTEEMLEQVDDDLDLLSNDHDWMSPDLREACEQVLPEPENIRPADANEHYILLKTTLENSESSDSSESESDSSERN